MLQRRLTRFALLLLLAFSTAACEDDDDGVGPDEGVARLRIVNAADIPNVDVRLVGTTSPLATDLDFRAFTQTCVEVPAGERALVFHQQGLELDVAAARFDEDESYTAFLVASGLRVRAVIVPDTAIASANNNALRFVNATTEAGDVYVTSQGTVPSAAFLVVGNSTPLVLSNELPSYLHRSVDHTQVRLFNVGVTTGSPRANFTLSGLPTTRLGTVVFTEGQTFLVTPCP